ncbi:MAG TPA: SprT family zinc-dependent metalloprotease [Stellaceae bacterium]|nr:SprT family zinc-dependent metalloprotease [Stellaceae bacterium]
MLSLLRRLSGLGLNGLGTAPAPKPRAPAVKRPPVVAMTVQIPRADGPDETVPVLVRHSAQARHIALKLSPSAGTVTLVVPRGVALARAMTFLKSRETWIVEHWRVMPPRIPFEAGAIIPVLGRDRLVVAAGAKRGIPPFRLTDETIEIGGASEHLPRRLQAGLTALARPILAEKSQVLAARLDRKIAKVTMGDPGQRWGSCNSRGNLRFSWRLILAPEAVIDYVAAHEVAHLVEMNHGPRFWLLVEQLAPGHAAQRAWLREHGTRLMRYG